jgi:hypothetical protein
MAKINFTCPECGDTTLVQAVLTKEYWTLGALYKDSDSVWCEQEALLDSENSSLAEPDFICNSCGYYVAGSDEDLWVWLKEHDMLILDEDDEID